MTSLAVDGLTEEEFRRSIESRLRQDKAGEAVERLRILLEPYAGQGRTLPERFLTVGAADLSLKGWQVLEGRIALHDRPGRPITALSIAFGWPGEDVPRPDDQGRLSPLIETGYYTDDAFPFSQSGRDDLLDGYSLHGCTWSGDCQASDTALTLEGIDDLHGALAALEARLLASDEPDEEEIRAGTLGSCLLSALLYQAVSLRIAHDGLPRQLCVMAGSNGVYPYFDAPVVGIPEDVRQAAEAAEESEAAGHQAPGPRYSSLLATGIPRAKKRAVLVLDENADEQDQRIASMRGVSHQDEAAAPQPDGPLMAGKQPGQAWDFRDMLGPRDPAPAMPAELPSADPAPEPQGWHPQPHPNEAPAPVTIAADSVPANPGPPAAGIEAPAEDETLSPGLWQRILRWFRRTD
ncbi:MAG: hypothetical protein JSR96_11130 [Proteobacteria bacterium]|nr:hypothetical protein [Pseudomonadota bacterium]